MRVATRRRFVNALWVEVQDLNRVADQGSFTQIKPSKKGDREVIWAIQLKSSMRQPESYDGFCEPLTNSGRAPNQNEDED